MPVLERAGDEFGPGASVAGNRVNFSLLPRPRRRRRHRLRPRTQPRRPSPGAEGGAARPRTAMHRRRARPNAGTGGDRALRGDTRRRKGQPDAQALASAELGLLLGRSAAPTTRERCSQPRERTAPTSGGALAVAGSAEFTGTLELHVGNLGAAERDSRVGCEALDRIGATSSARVAVRPLGRDAVRTGPRRRSRAARPTGRAARRPRRHRRPDPVAHRAGTLSRKLATLKWPARRRWRR